MNYSYFRKMARHLNVNCDFSTGYLVCDIPRDTVIVKIKIKTRWGKHMLKEDKKRWTEKFRPWGKCIPKMNISTARKVVSQMPKKPMILGPSLTQKHGFKWENVLGMYPDTSQTPPPQLLTRKMNYPMTLRQ